MGPTELTKKKKKKDKKLWNQDMIIKHLCNKHLSPHIFLHMETEQSDGAMFKM